jgi:hypothetical protein
MNLPLAVINLAQDQELESLPNGAPQIYWSQAAMSQECSGGVQMMIQAEILSLLPTSDCSVRLLGQWSVDSRTWHDFYSPLDGDLASGNGWTTLGNKLYYYGGLPQEYAPYVRFGLQVTGNVTPPGTQGKARLSAAVTLLPWSMPATEALADGLDVDSDTPVYSAPVATANYRSAVVCATISAYTNSGNALLSVEVSPFADPATAIWVPLASFAPVAADGPLAPLAVSLFGQQMRLKCTRASGATATFDVAAFAMLRV